MANRTRSGFCRDEGGAALIEAALILPLLLLIVFALVDLSWYFWQRSLVAKAAELGVRAAIVSDSVAEGPGLTPSESAQYWFGMQPGLSCFPRAGASPCPVFSVTCTLAQGCTCSGPNCRFGLSVSKLAPILSAMRAVLPRLKANNLSITYATNGLGYIGRPPPVGVDVTVQIVDLAFDPIFAGLLFRGALPLSASATLPGEALVTRR